MASPNKKARHDGKTKSFFAKQSRKAIRNSIEPGNKGFLVTCNFKERDSIRECYQLLNNCYKKLNPDVEDTKKENKDEDDDDITTKLQNQIEKTNQELKERAMKFVSVDTGVSNLIFIKTTIEDPLTLGCTIIRDLAESKIKQTKVTLRFIPIEAVCRAKMEDIKIAAGALFDKHFLKEPSTFGIILNRRHHSELKRDDVIKELAELVISKNIGNKVNLKDAKKSIIVEIIKSICMISVLPDYMALKKYNINELWAKKEEKISSQEEDVKDEVEDASEKAEEAVKVE